MSAPEPYIETASGRRFHFLDPRPEDIDIGDIAHALAMQCRYTGHTRRFYSVAEHSALVALLVEPEHRLAALLHDASEAYLTDVARPVKAFLDGYRPMEERLMHAIAQRFGFTWPPHESIKRADEMALLIEARQLLPSGGAEWGEFEHIDRDALPEIRVRCFGPAMAKQAFLSAYDNIVDPPPWEQAAAVGC